MSHLLFHRTATRADSKGSNVQVTLQILSAIVEKVPRDMSLYAGSILTILNTVLESKDMNMIEETIPTFESYCKHADAASLAADQARARQYLNIIQQYTAFGSLDKAPAGPSAQSVPASTRRRTIALRAIRAVVGSDALIVETSDQLNAVMPVILENLDLEKGGSLGSLQQKATTGEKQSTEMARKRRLSSATVPSVDEIDQNTATASETTADADKKAEEEVRVLAIRCLKQIFSISTGTSRSQMRLATALTLRFITMKDKPRPGTRTSSTSSLAPDWATTLFETIARWTPVQDRFIIVVTTVEALVRSPIVESILEKQLMLAELIDWLLRSDINLIGLSVMDVLLRLIQHTLLLLQLGSRDLTAVPRAQQQDALGLYRDVQTSYDPINVITQPERGRPADTKESAPSPVRKELLAVLQRCISDLATHIYYTDQISDMMTAIMARLKPSTNSDVATAAAAVNDPASATKAIADSANLQEDPSTDGFFSFATARIVALKSVREILLTVNSRRTSGGSSEVRSRVGVQVWDGTQWLLKDEDPDVRAAYVDAIVTWLRLETNRSDMFLPRDGTRKPRATKRDGNPNGELSMTKRAVSAATRREPKPPKSTFLQLLHLAIYDDAIAKAESETNILLLFLLLWTLVERLGVNAIRTGLPMVLNLQNDVLNGQTEHSATAKMHIASLMHGYLWAIAEKFDFESSPIGNEVNAEIARRKRFHCWLERMKFPPSSVAQIATIRATGEPHAPLSDDAVATLRPFLNVNAFVEEIAESYDRSLISPQSSPPSSPGRVFSVPTLGFGYGYSAAPVQKPAPENRIPQKIKDEMCGAWSREACIASVDKESNPSIAGSRTAASSTGRQHLSVGNNKADAASGRDISAPHNANAETTNPVLGNGLGSLSRARDVSTTSSLRDLDTSSRDSTMRVADLKRALAGANGDFRNHSPLRRPTSRSRQSTRSSGSDSMVSWNPADDDSLMEYQNARSEKERPQTAKSQQPGATYHDQTTITTNPDPDSDIPPVPKIPSALNLPMAGTWPRDASPIRKDQTAIHTGTDAATNTGLPPRPDTSSVATIPRSEGSRKRVSRPASRAGAGSVWNGKYATTGRKTDLTQLLASIQVDTPTTDEKRSFSGGSKVIKPPY